MAWCQSVRVDVVTMSEGRGSSANNRLNAMDAVAVAVRIVVLVVSLALAPRLRPVVRPVVSLVTR